MERSLEDIQKALVDAGKAKGFLTYSQVIDLLPEEANDGDLMDRLLLVLATGHSHARPALSLFLTTFDPANRSHLFLAGMNPFYFWMAAVLSIGLAKISEVSFAEAAFWVFGYWIGLRTALLLF